MGTITVRLSDDMTKQLDGVARSIDRSRSFIVKKAIDYYLIKNADLQIAKERLNDLTDEIVSLEEMSRELDV